MPPRYRCGRVHRLISRRTPRVPKNKNGRAERPSGRFPFVPYYSHARFSARVGSRRFEFVRSTPLSQESSGERVRRTVRDRKQMPNRELPGSPIVLPSEHGVGDVAVATMHTLSVPIRVRASTRTLPPDVSSRETIRHSRNAWRHCRPSSSGVMYGPTGCTSASLRRPDRGEPDRQGSAVHGLAQARLTSNPPPHRFRPCSSRW